MLKPRNSQVGEEYNSTYDQNIKIGDKDYQLSSISGSQSGRVKVTDQTIIYTYKLVIKPELSTPNKPQYNNTPSVPQTGSPRNSSIDYLLIISAIMLFASSYLFVRKKII